MGTDTANVLDEHWDTALKGVARRVNKQFTDVDRDDILQELRLWFLTDKWVTRYLESDERGKLAVAARRFAVTFAQTERAERDGYKREDIFIYSARVLRQLLPLVWDQRDWTPSAQAQEVSAKNPANEGGNLLAMLADVSAALPQLRQEDFLLLQQMFRVHLTPEELAEMEGVEASTIRSRVQRALRRLQRVLGAVPEDDEEYQGPGARQAQSNAAAIAGTER